MKLSKEKKVQIIKIKSTQPTWSISQLRPGASSAVIQQDQLAIGFPTMTQVIYPGQTCRINTGLGSTISGDADLTTYPQKGLLSAGINSFPQIISGTDVRNQGGQISQIVQNTNNFPVRIQYNPIHTDQWGCQIGPQIHRLDPQTLQQVQLLYGRQLLGDFDWMNLLKGAVDVGVKLLPLFI